MSKQLHIPTLPVTPAQPGIGRNTSCAMSDWLTSTCTCRPSCSQPRELWFLMYMHMCTRTIKSYDALKTALVVLVDYGTSAQCSISLRAKTSLCPRHLMFQPLSLPCAQVGKAWNRGYLLFPSRSHRYLSDILDSAELRTCTRTCTMYLAQLAEQFPRIQCRGFESHPRQLSHSQSLIMYSTFHHHCCLHHSGSLGMT